MNTTTPSRPSTPSRARNKWMMTLLATPVLVLALAGCAFGGAGAADPNPGNSAGAGAGQPSTDAEFSAARDDYDRKLAECLRDQGLDVKDPLPGAGITEDSPEIREAFPDCTAEIGDPPSSAGITLTPEELEKLLDRAKCLREMGYEIQEPTVTNPGFIDGDVTPEDFDTCQVEAGF